MSASTAAEVSRCPIDAPLLRQTADLAADFLEGLPTPAGAPAGGHEELLGLVRGAASRARRGSRGEVARSSRAVADPGLIARAPGRAIFGFVIGGALPAAIGADWLTSAWDQNAGLYVLSPAGTVAEEVVGAWLLELLGLPREASVGFVTGGQMANLRRLAAARHAVLERPAGTSRRVACRALRPSRS